MAWTTILLILPSLLSLAIPESNFIPCSEISSELRFPCKCSLGPIEEILDGNPAISLNCDRVVFTSDISNLPYGAPIVTFSQRWAGHQSLPTQIFSSSGLPLRSVDLSGNSLRRLTERMLQGLHATLVELRLADNLFGDSLNPIFSSSEFRGLTHLQLLDLSGNGIKAIEEGILDGCKSLQELYLDRNSFGMVPSSSLNGPNSLRILSLKENRIDIIKTDAFQAQKNLDTIDLRFNLIATIEAGAFSDLVKLRTLKLSHNRLSRFNSDVFQGAENLLQLDLSENFIVDFPSIAFSEFNRLRYLNLSSNMIQNIDNGHLKSLSSLYHLDLSRNNLANISPGTFLGLKQLRKLDISINTLRTIEDDAFEGLDNLEHLNLKDNNILLIPASALGRLPRLTSLHLDYNRVAALSGDILRSLTDKLTDLVISSNVVRELPPGSFQFFSNLRNLDLTRNLLTTLNPDAFSGLENTLEVLVVSQNKITSLSGPPLQLMKLRMLDLSDNNLKEISKNAFSHLPLLQSLNLSHNAFLSNIPETILHKLTDLEVLDWSHANVGALSVVFFAKSISMKKVNLSNNNITELPEKTFVNMPNITSIDLSRNAIANIRQGAFSNVMNLKELNLKGNHLSSFKGEFFNTGTGLEVLDISENELSYLYPSSFRIHPRLRQIFASKNKFNFFPAELIANLQFLEYIDLSGNELKTVEELDFARLPRLRTIILSGNNLETISEMAFHNSTQLQILDLSDNNIDRLGERIFEGLVRLEILNLEGNMLSDLPENIFDRSRLQMLENIRLSRNKFETAPLRALQRQYFFLNSVDLSRNMLVEIPADDSIMVNIKQLDLSFNPLSETAIKNVLGEPKTVRNLNLAGTGIQSVTHLETPFLRFLNLSYNNISILPESVFERTSLLEELDVYGNQITSIVNFTKIWSLLPSLQVLNVSGNPITSISQNDFLGLEKLRHLSLHSLLECEKIEKSAFKSVPNLASLALYGYPKLGYLDIHGVLQNVPLLEKLSIETKDGAISSDHLQSVLHPRLKELGIVGNRLKTISSGTLSGLKAPEVTIHLTNTSLSSLPPALFFSVPRSSRITLDVAGNQLTTVSPQMLTALEDRRGDLKIVGLESNPITCDCGARALRRWLPLHMTDVKCVAPQHLIGKYLMDVADDELTCDPRKLASFTSTPATTVTYTKNTKQQKKTTEPDIIWSMPVTEKTKSKSKPPQSGQSSINNDDTLIIGIVGGVVAFIAILVIVICIIRLRMTSNQYRGGPNPPMAGVVGSASSCACSVKGTPAVYALPPVYSATLPHKMGPGSVMRPANYSTMGRVPYYNNAQPQPYFIATYPDEKIYR